MLFFCHICPGCNNIRMIAAMLTGHFVGSKRNIVVTSVRRPRVRLTYRLLPSMGLIGLSCPIYSVGGVEGLRQLVVGRGVSVVVGR